MEEEHQDSTDIQILIIWKKKIYIDRYIHPQFARKRRKYTVTGIVTTRGSVYLKIIKNIMDKLLPENSNSKVIFRQLGIGHTRMLMIVTLVLML